MTIRTYQIASPNAALKIRSDCVVWSMLNDAESRFGQAQIEGLVLSVDAGDWGHAHVAEHLGMINGYWPAATAEDPAASPKQVAYLRDLRTRPEARVLGPLDLNHLTASQASRAIDCILDICRNGY